MAFARLANFGERLVYRMAGFPVALSGLLPGTDNGSAAEALQSAFAHRYWHPVGAGEWSELIGGLTAWPIALLLGCLWYTLRNGAVVRRRCGKGMAAQIGDQLRLYFSAGVLAPWYYIFSLHDRDGRKRATSFIHRFETKPCFFLLLKRRRGSPLNDKRLFAQYCVARGIRCVPTVVHFDGRTTAAALPDIDLFVKPTKGRGGTGAERWDRVASGRFEGPNSERLTNTELLAKLVRRSRRAPLIVQQRLQPHRALANLTTGALPTVRLVTCLDERDEPEVIGAVFRMSIGDNVTVDNLHAGGIAALVSPASGKLSRATNLGADAHLGWLPAHPDTRSPIESRTLPHWSETKALAVEAHRHFSDRVVVGWDIAILDDGPIIVEGNGNPDLDIIQRFMHIGLREHRFARLIAYHLRGVRNDFATPHSDSMTRADEAGYLHSHQRQADAGRARVGAQLPPE